MKSESSTRDVSGKPTTLRIARAAARLTCGPATVRAVKAGRTTKADPVGVAKVAAIQAAKQTSLLIPFCHQVPIDAISVTITAGRSWFDIETVVTAVWKTGVEMEALTAASAAALTLYDMLKPVDPMLRIEKILLAHKSGGKSSASADGRGVRAAVIVLSDSISAGKGKDLSGQILVRGLRNLRARVPVYRVLPDDRAALGAALRGLTDRGKIDLVIACGGTGSGPRDVTAGVVAGLIDERLHGVEAAFFSYGQERTPTAMLSRCIAGTRNRSLILGIPGSPGAAGDALKALFPALFHIFAVMKGGRHG
jgi:cyclic pyranopterin phosphate synthase